MDRRSRVALRDLVSPIVLLTTFFIVLTVSGVLAVLIYFHHHLIAGSRFLHSLTADNWTTQSLTVLIYLVFLFIIWRVIRRLMPEALVGGFVLPPASTLLLAALGGVGFALLVIALDFNLQAFHLVIFHITPSERAMEPQNWAQLPLVVLSLVVLAPLAEESYFRGLWFSWLDNRYGRLVAILGSGLIFSLIHFRFAAHIGFEGLYLSFVIFGLGLINGLWVAKTRSLWPAVAAHAAYNACLILFPLLLMGWRLYAG